MPRAMPDLIVVIPGIIGSTLIDRNGEALWGVSPGTIVRSILRLGQNLDALRLPEGIGDDPSDDWVRPGALIPIPHIIGKLFGTDGYGHLIASLQARFDLRMQSREQPGNLIALPYDWRLSNRVAAKRIENELVPQLEAWRRTSGNPDAKFRFICHSMGGLVARWFTEVLGGRELTRQIITIGTPHRGAAKALVNLANGVNPCLGPLNSKLTEVIRSFPSVHQLLPTYRCVETIDGRKRLGEIDVPDIDRAMLTNALAFHDRILTNAKTGAPADYGKFALKGIAQPTLTSVQIGADGLIPLNTIGGNDWAGDGTVPRLSSHFGEWVNDGYAPVFGQQHSSLQSDSSLHRQLFSILTTSEIETSAGGASEAVLGLDLPEMIEAGAPFALSVTSPFEDSTLPLKATLFDGHGKTIESHLMRNLYKGRYEATFKGIAPDLVSVRIESATPYRPFDPITGWTLVWDPKAEV